MPKDSKPPVWRGWGKRLTAHVRAHRSDIKWNQIARDMDVTEGALRHWRNGRNPPPLDEFFKLCQLTRSDPRAILFGNDEEEARLLDHFHHLNDNDKTRLVKFAEDLRATDPTPNTDNVTTDLQSAKTRRKRG